jgi:hypothetical protein
MWPLSHSMYLIGPEITLRSASRVAKTACRVQSSRAAALRRRRPTAEAASWKPRATSWAKSLRHRQPRPRDLRIERKMRAWSRSGRARSEATRGSNSTTCRSPRCRTGGLESRSWPGRRRRQGARLSARGVLRTARALHGPMTVPARRPCTATGGNQIGDEKWAICSLAAQIAHSDEAAVVPGQNTFRWDAANA